jgi:MFS family permease
LAVLCLASLGWAFSFGVGAPLASLWLQDAGCSATVIGLNTGVYYLGIALTAALVPWMVRHWGRGCVGIGMAATGLTVAMFPWGGSLFGWFVLRLLNGVAGAMSLIPLETWINRHAAPEQRSRNFGYYAFCMALGIALGTLMGTQIYSPAPRLAFVLGGAVALAGSGVVVYGLPWPKVTAEERPNHTPLVVGRHLLTLGSAWSQGFLEGGMVALMPVYLLAVGLSKTGVGWLMSAIMIGVILSQVPLAWLADRLGRTGVLLGCYAVTVGVLAALLCRLSLTGLAVCLFLAGACSSAFYPLGLALLGEQVPDSGLEHANAWFLGINCLGSLVGPVVAGAAMDQFGKHALFAAGEVAVLLVLLLWAVPRIAEFFHKKLEPVPDKSPDREVSDPAVNSQRSRSAA